MEGEDCFEADELSLTQDELDALKQREGDKYFSETLMRLCPVLWHGQDIVDLDDMDDGLSWLYNEVGDIEFALTDDSGVFIDHVTDAYLAGLRERGIYGFPSDFDSEADYQAFVSTIRTEICALFRAWRKAVAEEVAKLESPPAPPDADDPDD